VAKPNASNLMLRAGVRRKRGQHAEQREQRRSAR
jgi:hypothetical protein